MLRHFDETEKSLIVLSLRIAAEKYDNNFATSIANREVSDLFNKQANQARNLADEIEDCSKLIVESAP